MSSPLTPSDQPAADTPAAVTPITTPVTAPAELQPDLPRAAQAAFVRTLAQWGNVRAAAAQVGVSRAHLYRMRRASEEFRSLWDAALVLARPQVEEVLADRALNGVQESVFYHGEEIATRTRYDSRLLLAHLARLDRVEGRGNTFAALRDFDGAVERLLAGPVVCDWDDDDDDYDDYDDAAEDADDGAQGAAAGQAGGN
jgi:hypothetical protein